MPHERNTGITCPKYKKGDTLECNNHRGIILLNNAYKIFSRILNERQKIATENIIGKYQCGFLRNKSTIDQIFIPRRMVEKHNERGLDLHMLFINFKLAFHNINRKRLFEAMDKMGFYVYGSVHHNIFYEITNRCSYMQSILFHC